MNTADRSRLGVSFVGSLCINALVVLPTMLTTLTNAPAADATPEAAHQSELELPYPLAFELGIDESEASTLTWVGWEDYQEHVAQRAEFEQAQLEATQGDFGSGAPAVAKPVQPETPLPPAQPAPPLTAEQSAPITTTDAADTPADEPPTSLPDAPDALPITPADTPGVPTPPVAEPDVETPADADTPAEADRPAEPAPTPAQPATPAAPVTPPAPTPDDTTSEPDDTTPGRKGVEDAPLRLDGGDRDSDATSIIDVSKRDLNLGRPVARQGLKLYPRKPAFTSLRVISSGGKRGVLARLVFNTSSKTKPLAPGQKRWWPAEAYIGRLITTGKDAGTVRWFNQVNLMGPLEQSIHSSLFSWTASGEQLTAVTDGQPVIVNLDLQISVR